MKNLSNRSKGIFFILLAGIGFACMNVLVRLSGDLPTYEKAFFRNFISVIVAVGMVKKSHVHYTPKKEHIWPLFARAAFGTVGLLCNFYAVDHLLLADANMLNKLSPFFAIVFSFLILKEKVKPVQALGLVAAFCGSLLVVKPSFDFAKAMPALIGFIGGVAAGGAHTYIRMLGTRQVPGPVVILAFSAFSCLVCLPMLVMGYVPMSLSQLACLLLAGCAATVGQFCLTTAYRYAPAREISAFDYMQVIFSAILGFFIFQQMPDGWSILGYAVIIGAAVAMAIYNNRQAHRQTP